MGNNLNCQTALILNVGSSTVKAALFRFGALSVSGDSKQIEPESHITELWRKKYETPLTQSGSSRLHLVLDDLIKSTGHPLSSRSEIDLVVHRIVHGGSNFLRTTTITSGILEQLERLNPLAPLHNPPAMELIQSCLLEFPQSCPQLAVFDTAFYCELPRTSTELPLPKSWRESGIRKFGFHGINHQYLTETAAKLLNTPLEKLSLISCHLGNGCSVTAIRQGKPVETSMSFTPLDGLVMGSRCGAIDPGILLWQLKNGLSVAQIEDALNKQSGLLGVSCLSSDMRTVKQAATSGNSEAQLAREIFIHRLCFYISGYRSYLEDLDAIVFSGGIGENDEELRLEVGRRVSYLGAKQLVIPADEETQMAIEAARLLDTSIRGG